MHMHPTLQTLAESLALASLAEIRKNAANNDKLCFLFRIMKKSRKHWQKI